MPIKEFVCNGCGFEFEVIHLRDSFDGVTSAYCPACNQLAPAKEISLTGAPILKSGVGGFHRPTRGERHE
jgi:putative FmdB family regulatory protein